MQTRASTGIEGFDDILGGGLPDGHLYLIEGDPGAGKTTMALQFLQEGRRLGEVTLYVTLSETRAEVEKVALSHGWDLTGVNIMELTTSVEAALGEDSYTVFRPSDMELGETTTKILDEVARLRPHRVVIDSLSELRLLAGEALRYRRQILGLKHSFAKFGCTLLVLDDRTVRSNDQQPQSIAHGVIALDRIPTEYGAERRRLQIVKLRGVGFKGGFHDYCIRHGGLAVFPRLKGSDHERDYDEGPVASGMKEFDLLLGGGLDRGTSTLLTGPAGTGKSTLAMTLVDAAARRGEKAAIFAFEENRKTAVRRCGALGIPLQEHLTSGIANFRHVLPAELSPGEFAALVRESVDNGARMVVMDSLNGYLNAMPEEGFLAAQLHELLSYLSNQGVVTIMVLAQRGMMGSGMTAPVDVSYLADTVIMLRHFEAFGSVRKAISVLKKRTGSHEETIRELRFDGGKMRIGEALSDFRGVLTGVPTYVGLEKDLSGKDSPRAAP